MTAQDNPVKNLGPPTFPKRGLCCYSDDQNLPLFICMASVRILQQHYQYYVVTAVLSPTIHSVMQNAKVNLDRVFAVSMEEDLKIFPCHCCGSQVIPKGGHFGVCQQNHGQGFPARGSLRQIVCSACYQKCSGCHNCYCIDAVSLCGKCHKYYCRVLKCIVECHVCHTGICEKCVRRCSECHKYACHDHYHEWFCQECWDSIPKCAICKRKLDLANGQEVGCDCCHAKLCVDCYDTNPLCPDCPPDAAIPLMAEEFHPGEINPTSNQKQLNEINDCNSSDEEPNSLAAVELHQQQNSQYKKFKTEHH